MHSQALQQYLKHLNRSNKITKNLWVDDQGRASGRYFNSTLTSVFHPIRSGITHQIAAYEAYSRSYSSNDQGLNIWRLLDSAANDDESVELDRLCRILHTINFYRQPESGTFDLLLSVHSRLLAAVEGNHGSAFRHILDVLELPHQHIILQLPQITPSQRWVLSHVAENYRRNGFRVGVNASTVEQATDFFHRIHPDTIKLDIHHVNDAEAAAQLLALTDKRPTKVIFKRVENTSKLGQIVQFNQEQHPFYVKGFYFDQPRSTLISSISPALAPAAL